MLVLLHAALGLALGWLRPPWAVAALLGGVSVTSSLWWHLGLENLATPLAYVVGLLLGMPLRGVVRPRGGTGRVPPPARGAAVARIPGNITVAATLTIVSVLAATLLSVLREHPAATLPLALRTQLRGIFDFHAGGLAGELQAALIAVVGPLLLLATAVALHDDRARSLAVKAFAVGAAVAATAGLLQGLLSDPWVRPDKDGALSTGLVGTFQDPHSHAAYLLLAIGVVAAAGINAARDARQRAALAHTILGALVVAMLIGTNSKTGLVALAIVGLCALAAREYRGNDPGSPRSLLVPGSIVAAPALVLAAIFFIAPLRQATYDGLRTVGAGRMAQPLAADADWNRILGYRPTRWAATLDIAGRRPLWGAGPRSIEKLPLGRAYDVDSGQMQPIPRENTHNYFLQFAAEYGLPAAAALIWLLAAVVGTTAAGALRHPSAHTRTLLAGILAGQIGFLLFSVVSHPMLLAECQATFWALCGLAVSGAQAGTPAGS